MILYIKKSFLRHCVVFFLLFCFAIVISEPFFEGAFFRPDFAAIGREKFAARYFWFEAKLKQKKFIAGSRRARNLVCTPYLDFLPKSIDKSS